MDKKRKYSLFLCLLGMLCLFSACGKQDTELADDVFLLASVTAKGEAVETYEMYTLNLEFHQDGTVRCYADHFNRWLSQEECPVETMKLSEDEIAGLKARIEEVDLYHMRETLGSRDVKEGEYKSLTVYTTEGEHTSGGLNPSNQDFLTVYDYVDSLTREMAYRYRTRITEMQEQGLAYNQRKGLVITDSQENELVGNEDINDVYVTFGAEHIRCEELGTQTDAQTIPEGAETDVGVLADETDAVYYVTIKLSDEAAEDMEFETTGCNPDLPEYYKLYENGAYDVTFGVWQQIKNGELYVFETKDAAEADAMAKQLRSSVYDY